MGSIKVVIGKNVFEPQKIVFVESAQTNVSTINMNTTSLPLEIITNVPKELQITSIPVNLKGDTGMSAYQVALDSGFVGTETEWLNSLVGDQQINWLTLVTSNITEPVLIRERLEYVLYEYTYSDKIYYRKISLVSNEDIFYRTYDGESFIDLIASKQAI